MQAIIHKKTITQTNKITNIFILIVSIFISSPVMAIEVTVLEQSVVRVLIIDANDKLAGVGSGFVVSDSGHVVTNNHVVDGAAALKIVDKETSGITTHDATVVWASAPLDLAIIHVPDLHRLAVTISEKQPAKLSEVIAIGYPAAADLVSDLEEFLQASVNASVTNGVVSRIQPETVSAGVQIPIIQHNADISGGNSGGPLFNACGEVIGINTKGKFGGTSSGLFFSVSATTALRELRRLNISISSS
ncbi:MAG: serine protease, partial [Mariprofundales bacterium]